MKLLTNDNCPLFDPLVAVRAVAVMTICGGFPT